MSDVAKLNVYGSLSPSLVAQVESLSDALATFGLETFHRRGRPLHCTLYVAEFERAEFPLILERVRAIAATFAPLPVRSSGLTRTRNDWLFLDLDRTQALLALSTRLAESLCDRRAPHRPPPSWTAAYPEKRATFERWGSPNVGEHFDPHLTLLASAPADALDRLLASTAARMTPVEGQLEALHLGLVDDDGQLLQTLI